MQRGESFAESDHCGGHVGTKRQLATMNTQEPIGPKGLHQSLDSALPEDALEILPNAGPSLSLQLTIIHE